MENSFSRFNGIRNNQDQLFEFSNFESEVLAFFNKEAKFNAKNCGYFSYVKKYFGGTPDELVSTDVLIEIKTRAAGSAGPLEDLRKSSCYFIETQLQMVLQKVLHFHVMSF